MPDDLVAEARQWLSPGELYGFAAALFVLEFSLRTEIAGRRLSLGTA
jgi:hypothetical protein